jgi:antibiotic biosynthesis monooxygenase (ABM) superfamily enzyme
MVRLVMPSPPPVPAAFVISRVMRPGHEEAYGSWVDRVIAAAQVDGGFMSAVRLDQAGSLHHLVLHFDERPSLERWWEGATYIALASEADAFSVGLDQNDSGSVMGFDLPIEVAAKKWKTALVTWLGVVPTLLIVSSVVAWALPDVPRVLQQIVSSVLLTSALTWLILPKVRGWSRFWMMQNEQGDLRKEPG